MLRWLFGKKSGTEHTKAQAASHERNIDNQAPTETRQSSLGAHPPHGDSKSGTFPQSSLENTTDNSTHPTASARVLVTGQDDAEVHYSRGKRLLEDDQFENAIASLLDALRCKPDFPEAHFRLGKCWQGLGKPDKAMASYLEAVRINPAYAEAHNNLGVLHHELGDAQHAINYYQRAVDLKPELAPAHFNLALLQLGKGKIDDAIQSFRRLFEVDPDFPDAHTNLLFYLSHDTTQSPQTVFDAHRAYADRVEAPLRPAWPLIPIFRMRIPTCSFICRMTRPSRHRRCLMRIVPTLIVLRRLCAQPGQHTGICATHDARFDWDLSLRTCAPTRWRLSSSRYGLRWTSHSLKFGFTQIMQPKMR